MNGSYLILTQIGLCLGASVIKLIGHKLNVWLAKKLVPGFHEHLISRTRFIDDLVERSTASEFEQYVILGRGTTAELIGLNFHLR